MTDYVASESDDRIVNNAVRHQYRVLSDAEKGLWHRTVIDEPAMMEFIAERVPAGREASIAKTKVEEAVMWAVKGLTG